MNLRAVPVADAFPYEGPAELREPITAALTRVVDPELALSIVDVAQTGRRPGAGMARPAACGESSWKRDIMKA